MGRSAELPEGFVEETLADHLNAATAIAVAPDGRIFVAEQTGLLRLWKDGRLIPDHALDLSQRVDTYWERGLIGVTLPPDFPRTPQLFIVYVARSPFPHHVISSFAINGDVVDPSSERVLLEGDDQTKIGGKLSAGHQGGPIRFGKDGKLYIAIGEQTARQPSQSLQSLQGKVLRINRDGSIPDDNPFVSEATGKYRSIWAIGLRNPFGLGVQPETGRVFVTDVGETSFEEVNEIFRGANYGWPFAEGISNNARFKDPLHAYAPFIGRSICGAAFYPNDLAHDETAAFPKKWRGKFFFADWAAHWVNALDPNAPETVLTFGRGFNGPVALEIMPDGALLVLNRGTIWRDNKQFVANTGSLVRIRYVGDDRATKRRTSDALPPPTLAATGLFVSLSPLAPDPRFLAFEINAPPWQPGVQATRWITVPVGKQIAISADGECQFPPGAIIIEHYQQLAAGAGTIGPSFETHLFWCKGGRVARAAAYRWASDARDATLVSESQLVTLPGSKRHWFSPGSLENLNLDSPVVVGFLLPVSARQLNREITERTSNRRINQLALWSERGWLDSALLARNEEGPRLAALDDQTVSAGLRVRSYLDVHCAMCHRPGGLSRSAFDARFITPLDRQRLLNEPLIAGDLGIAEARVIVPDSPERSVLYQRVKRNDFFHMPPGETTDEPSPLLPVLEQWIRDLR
jgi:glucose/arabinose dehydrogenase